MAKILAVDDAIIMRSIVKSTLELSGHEVICFESGETALSWAQNQKIDLVISDQYMPGMKGTTLIGKLRELSHLQGVPMLILSTESKDEVKQLAKDNGANGWIQKPIVPEDLTNGVNRVLDKYKN